ncbi:reverse transcriptase domain, Reverse transcriptase zinc-binding domain protein [Artemisia annua]|uniref:Reverse transcriptase domain, Reverse transcriptase zinc-binding domain protein n=1 Tax=Artemisia annua TaxID=35608 RepID=A0A2U1LGQ4_ARTAN|nr:reverse transcriptase domain, Reverse transcriptase zinc-binding domain protein [Artemisia annua]
MTQDKMMVWNGLTNMKCTLCNVCNDSHNNLFFNCAYAKKIWETLKKKAELSRMGNDWQDIVNSMAARKKCKDFYTRQKRCRDFSNVSDSVRMQLVSLKVKRSFQVDDSVQNGKHLAGLYMSAVKRMLQKSG